ncbi:lipid asymmetry maintenance protein MlaB [Luteimonas sp. R10]|uniref:STAS domain-containing protein n=1 Tax=Luteimonas sp. R10 TaxID=3108176 RepID=UPI00308D8EBA|nr:STAS domain-containing protein [Luteimonas sp. R10]
MNAVPLGEDLGIESCAELKARLAPCLAQEQPLLLDGSRVARVHTAGVQVLCALARSRADAGLSTELDGCSEALRDAIRILGLDAQFGLAPDQTTR